MSEGEARKTHKNTQHKKVMIFDEFLVCFGIFYSSPFQWFNEPLPNAIGDIRIRKFLIRSVHSSMDKCDCFVL